MIEREHPFFDERYFGNTLVEQLKRALKRPVAEAPDFWSMWQKSYYRVIYDEQDMKLADLMLAMSKWVTAQIVYIANEWYSKETGKPMLATMVEYQTKEVEDAIKHFHKTLVKEPDVIKHFKNNGQGEWINGFPSERELKLLR